MANRIRAIKDLGQAIWLDFISRDLLASGELRTLVNEGLTGMTSNPTIFQKAISSGTEYDDQIRELANAGKSADQIYEALVFRDIGGAADTLRTVYDERHGRDGFVSIEVDPRLAHDTDGTIAEARRIFAAIDRPNVMIKVPGTEAGIAAVRSLIGEGINVNVTLIFSIGMYEKIMQAYIDGLTHRRTEGKPVGVVASVASFFVSRVDSLVDRKLNEMMKAGQSGLQTLLGKAAVANAKIAYDRYQHVFETEAFAPFLKAGAQVQRPLWASTSTKNPAYPDTKYVDTLIGPNTVNTVPPSTLAAIRDHAAPARTVDLDPEQAFGAIEKLTAAGIRMDDVTDELLAAGIASFADSFEQLIKDIEAKRARFASRS